MEHQPDEAEPDRSAVRVLVLASAAVRSGDLGFRHAQNTEVVRFLHSIDGLELALEKLRPDVVLIDTVLADEHGFEVIDDAITMLPSIAVLALTPSPPPHEHVAGAMRAGARGFIPLDSTPGQFGDAVQAVFRGQISLPDEATRLVLSEVADDLDTSRADRLARLQGMVFALIPLAGGLTAVMALLWRRYLGQIGVRPVDVAIEPSSRIVDAYFALSLLVGILGPLSFVGTWLDLVRPEWTGSRFTRERFGLQVALTVSLFAALVAIAHYSEVVMALFIGPAVGAIFVALILGAEDMLPRFLRAPRLLPSRVIAAGASLLVVFLAVLSVEVMVVGPSFTTRGANGFFTNKFLGFKAQPMHAVDVNGQREAQDVLYLGGNADLYVLVDPCNDDLIEFVSVGSTRLVVIEEVNCE